MVRRFGSLLVVVGALALVPVASAGHLPHWEQPGAVHPVLIEFLRQ